MQILVPTYGRAKQSAQSTLLFLRQLGIQPTLVVQQREAHLYDWHPDVEVLPEHVTTIAPTRDYIVSTLARERYITMMDDDLVFFKRNPEDRTKFVKGEVEDFQEMLNELETMLTLHPHVGVAGREGGNRRTEHFIYDTRMMRVLGYDTQVMKEEGITFSPMEVMEDFHVSLQFLRKGHTLAMLNDWCHNQGSSGSAGGCSHFRTSEVQARNAHRLKELHPNFVSVVTKTTKTAWGGGERTDVIVQWKKAKESSSVKRT